MNRIAGILNLDGALVHSIEIHRMLAALTDQRGAEDTVWVEGTVGFGCTRFGGLPVEIRDHLLSNNPHEGHLITFDGRIDNRRELLAVLGPPFPGGRSHISDEELVLAAYEKWELDCPGHLIGDFAFALWDRRKHRLLCARDHFGVKPFYYAAPGKSFLFASAPHALLASGKVPPLINEDRIADHLINPLEGVDKISSFYMDVYRLPPAHLLVVGAQGVSLRRYSELCPSAQSGAKTEAEYIEEFRALFDEAVRCRLDDLAVPASMLSGGMDSSAIVGVGRRVLGEEGRSPLHAFAVRSNGNSPNRESSYISSVLAQENLQPHLISESNLQVWMDELVKAIETEAEPFDCLMNLNRAVYLHAHDHGVRALLDGVDGDVLLADSGHLNQLWQKMAYRTILEETLGADGLTAEYKMGRKLFTGSLLSVVSTYAPGWLRRLRRGNRYRRVIDSSIEETIINREFAIRAHLGERFARLDAHSPRPASPSQMDFHKIALDHPFLTVGLERYERVASAFGIEARHPFTDVRLAEFCLGLPWQLKTRRGWTKLILRRAMEPDLPSEVVWRRDKDSLMWEVNRLVLRSRADYFYQVTLDEKHNLKPYVDTVKLMKYWQEYLTQGDETHAILIWSGIALALWLRRHRNMTADRILA